MQSALRVLVVEDSADDAELVIREIRRGGIESTFRRVESADELRAALEEEDWDIILSDYSLPSFDGLKAFELVKARALDIPFIIISGTMGEEIAVRAMKNGVSDYILKDKLARLPAAIQREIREAENRRRGVRARAALEIEERRYQSIFNSASVGMWEVDFSGVSAWLGSLGVTDGGTLKEILDEDPGALRAAAAAARILNVNASTISMFGASTKDDLLGAGDFTLDMGFANAWVKTLEALALGHRYIEIETTVRALDGSPIRIIASMRLPHEANDLSHVVVTNINVTDRWELERQMRAAQRLEAVGRLAGGVAHDFNNILTVILSYTDFLREELRDRPAVYEDVETIEGAALRAVDLTSQLLAFSRKQVQQLTLVSLNQSVIEVQKMLHRLIGADIDVRISLADDLGAIMADPGQIEQILMNLAVNARDAMPDGGELILETFNVDLDDAYGAGRHVVVPPGSYVMLAVTDTGMGMPREVCAQVFEPFFTTKAEGKGTGLGLSTVYGIVKQSGGFIWVYSEPGHGTCFKLYFPRREGQTKGDGGRRRRNRVGGSETILLVEDEDSVRSAAKRILSGHGYRVIEAVNGRDALSRARAEERIHLILTDMVMPEMGGRGLIEALSDTRPDAKVVCMSGYTDTGLVEHGELGAGVKYLQKPFSTETLLHAVREAMDED